MDKPVIFFSHSSKDKAALAKLKELFVEKTGATIEVFLSSDGQSIPLGRNWVHRVEKGLVEAKLMVVFMTPNSLESNWIYFEAGYAHSRNIRVIPVGFLGVDLGSLQPPISLLQGFNIKNHEGLNNLIAVANEDFSFKHGESFNQENYNSVVILSDSTDLDESNRLPDDLEEVRVSVPNQEMERFQEVADFASKRGLRIFKGKESFRFPGGNVTATVGHDRKVGFTFSFSPQFWQNKFELTCLLINEASKNGFQNVAIECRFPADYEVIKGEHRIGGLLMAMDIGFSETGLLTFRGMPFEVGILQYANYSAKTVTRKRSNAYVTIRPRTHHIKPEDISVLLNVLRENGVVGPPIAPMMLG